MLKPDQVLKEFTDGRVISRFSEHWAAVLFEFEKSKNTNEKSTDGKIVHPLLGSIRIGVRSLTNSGIKFQDSKYIGSGRKCDDEALIESISKIDFEIVVDIIDFPQIYFVPINSKDLMDAFEAGKLTCNGLRRRLFYELFFNVTGPEELNNDIISIAKYKEIYSTIK